MKILFIVLVAIFLSSCGVKEENRPFAPVKTIDEQLQDKVFHIDLPLNDYDITEYADSLKLPFPLLGGFFKRSAQVISNLIIGINSDSGSKEIDNIEFQLNELDDVDFEFIESVNLKFIDLRVREVAGMGNLEFVKSIEVYLQEKEGESLKSYLDSKSKKFYSPGKLQILTYEKDDKRVLLNHNRTFSWIRLHSNIENWKTILQTKRNYSVFVRVKVGSVPTKRVSFEGLVAFDVRLNKLGL